MMRRKRVFFDKEFTGLHQNTTIISIGLITEDGETFYAECTDYDKTQIDKWLQENVIDNLSKNDEELRKMADVTVKGTKGEVGKTLAKWLRKQGQVVMWSDCLSYDWMLFNSFFGSALDLPNHIYYIPMDICTLMVAKGVDPDISREEFTGFPSEAKHNSLHDAKVIRAAFDRLSSMPDVGALDY